MKSVSNEMSPPFKQRSVGKESSREGVGVLLRRVIRDGHGGVFVCRVFRINTLAEEGTEYGSSETFTAVTTALDRDV